VGRRADTQARVEGLFPNLSILGFSLALLALTNVPFLSGVWPWAAPTVGLLALAICVAAPFTFEKETLLPWLGILVIFVWMLFFWLDWRKAGYEPGLVEFVKAYYVTGN